MDVRQFLDSTYLKTPEQAGLSHRDNLEVAKSFIAEAISEKFKCIMIRPDMVAVAHEMITAAGATTDIGTVIDFPFGTADIAAKLAEARKAISDGADDLDFVCNYEAFKNGQITLVKDEVLQGTKLAIEHKKVAKWIIEVAALNNQQIIQISALIKNVIITNFKEDDYQSVFVKSSTGFYPTDNDVPNGATKESITMMLENASPLPVKAAGGVRTYDEAVEMIRLGVKRIGTSSAKKIVDGYTASGY
ncbi:MAG: deoxyribose-phosphate aldolase [Flavobacterium sp.]|nr:deoxyribose-phosphate aldolase [Flavobacterium sp.]